MKKRRGKKRRGEGRGREDVVLWQEGCYQNFQAAQQ